MEQRIEKLEQQCRWYRNLFVLAGLMLVALVTWGSIPVPMPDVIRARSFEVVHENGTTVGNFMVSELGGGYLSINNEKGVPTVSATSLPITHGGYLKISDAQHRIFLELTHTDNGGKVKLNNKTFETVVQLEVDEYGNGVVGAYNRKGMGRTLKPGP